MEDPMDVVSLSQFSRDSSETQGQVNQEHERTIANHRGSTRHP